jgi:citrate synthase
MEIIGECRMLPENFTEDMIIKAPSRDIMNKLARAILALYSYDENPDDNSLPNMMRQSIELIARFPTIVAHAYQVKKHYYDSKSMYIHFPRNNLSTAENFLRTIRSDKKFTPTEARLLDLSLILHAEHGGGNNSAFAARLLSSTGTDTYSAISAAVGSLKGPKHGGANIKVNGMFDHIKANIKDWEDDDEILAFLKKIINKEAGDGSGLIYGIGHAVYTISDPRAVILRDNARLLAKEKGMETEFNLLNAVERLAPTAFNEVRGEKKVMCANVDLYSGMVYRMLNIPPELFTPLFAIARIAGWAAHRIEEITTNGKIMRPAYKFVGDLGRYTPLDER